MLLTCGIVESMYGALTDFPAFVLMTLAAVVGGSRGAGLLGLSALTREVNLLGLAGILEFGPPWRDACRKNLRRGAIAIDPVRALVLLRALAAALAGQPFARRPLLLDGRQQPRLAVPRDLPETPRGPRRHRARRGRLGPEAGAPTSTRSSLIATLTQCLYLITHPEWKNRLWRVGLAFVPYFSVISYNVWESHFTVTRHALPLHPRVQPGPGAPPEPALAHLVSPRQLFRPLRHLPVRGHGLAGPSRQIPTLEGGAPPGTVAAAYRDGWHGQEWKNHRTWRWAMSQQATLVLTNAGTRAGHGSASAFASESLVARDLRVSVGGAPVWQGQIAAKPVLTPVRTGEFVLPPGDTVVNFATELPPRLENDNPDARPDHLHGYRPADPVGPVAAPAQPCVSLRRDLCGYRTPSRLGRARPGNRRVCARWAFALVAAAALAVMLRYLPPGLVAEPMA